MLRFPFGQNNTESCKVSVMGTSERSTVVGDRAGIAEDFTTSFPEVELKHNQNLSRRNMQLPTPSSSEQRHSLT
jgi:hypothetical protein